MSDTLNDGLFFYDEQATLDLPSDCMPTRRGYPWANIIRRYGLDALREAFKVSNWRGCEESYHAETRFLAWYKRTHGVELDRITTDY